MRNKLPKYRILPILYILSVVLMELFPNIITSVIWIVLTFLCLIGTIRILNKKENLKRKSFLVLLLTIPFFDLTFGITNSIRNEIKGEIVLSLIDDSYATTKSLTIRKKKGKLSAELYNSFAGFGNIEKAKAELLNDSTINFRLINRVYAESLIFNRQAQIFTAKEKNSNYRILENKLFKP